MVNGWTIDNLEDCHGRSTTHPKLDLKSESLAAAADWAFGSFDQ